MRCDAFEGDMAYILHGWSYGCIRQHVALRCARIIVFTCRDVRRILTSRGACAPPPHCAYGACARVGEVCATKAGCGGTAYAGGALYLPA